MRFIRLAFMGFGVLLSVGTATTIIYAQDQDGEAPPTAESVTTATLPGDTPEATISAATAVPATAVATAEPMKIGENFTLAVTLLVDGDGDGRATSTDQPAGTLVELQSDNAVVPLFSGEDGRFVMERIPAGVYTLWVWWPGFIGVAAEETNPNLFKGTVNVSESGDVTAAFPSTILLQPKPEGLIPYPIRTGTNAAQIPIGRVDIAAALSQSGTPLRPAALPSTGGRSRNQDTIRWLLPLTLFVAAAPASVWALSRTRQRS